MKKPTSKLDKRNEKIRQMWETRLYTKSEIGRRLELSRERVRQILDQIDTEVPYVSDEVNWQDIVKIRELLHIPTRTSTQRQLEKGMGIYKYSRLSIATAEYLVYVLESALDRLKKLEKLLKGLRLPQT